jgi:hypothetical protein
MNRVRRVQDQSPTTSKKWSGKRDSNPRLRPWQGRTLPLIYSRPPGTLQGYHSDCLLDNREAPPAAGP